MCGSRLEISYVVGWFVREDAEGREILRGYVEGHIDTETASLASV
jgi:hypothetical protein